MVGTFLWNYRLYYHQTIEIINLKNANVLKKEENFHRAREITAYSVDSSGEDRMLFFSFIQNYQKNHKRHE